MKNVISLIVMAFLISPVFADAPDLTVVTDSVDMGTAIVAIVATAAILMGVVVFVACFTNVLSVVKK